MKKHDHITEDPTLPNNEQKAGTQKKDGETAPPSAEQLQDAVVAESDPLAKMEVELAAAGDKYLRLLSEFENYKKRVARDRIDMVKMAGTEILLSVLPVLDDLERALKASETSASGSDGIVLIYNKLKSIMESKGLKAMESEGTSFDADLHDAISSFPGSEGEKGKVVQEIEKGYYLNDKVVRHAKVIVGA